MGRSFVSLLASLLVGERSVLFGFVLLLSGLGVDHPPRYRSAYLAALEKVETLTPLILPSASSWSLMRLGWTQVSLVVEVYFTSVGSSMPLQQLPLLQFSVIFPQVLAQRFSDFTAGMYPTYPGTCDSIPPDGPSCCSPPSLAGTYPMYPTIGAFLAFTSIILLVSYKYLPARKQNLIRNTQPPAFIYSQPTPKILWSGSSWVQLNSGFIIFHRIAADNDGSRFHPVHSAEGEVLAGGLLGRDHIYPAHAEAREEREQPRLLPELLQGLRHQRGAPDHRRGAAGGQGHAGARGGVDDGGHFEHGGGGDREVHSLPVPELDGGEQVPHLLPARLRGGHPAELQDARPAAQSLPGERPRDGVRGVQSVQGQRVQRDDQGGQRVRLQPRGGAAGVQAAGRDRDGAVDRDGGGAGADAEGESGRAGADQSLRQHQVAGPRGGRVPGPLAGEVSIQAVTCPTFFLHGRRDDVISPDNTAELARLCVAKKQVLISPEMTHSAFDFYSDLADPLREFLMHNHFNFYEPNQQGPVVPDGYFQFPEGFKL